MKHELRLASSYKAWKERIWPRREWGVFDRDGNLLFATAKRVDAVKWRLEAERMRRKLATEVEDYEMAKGASGK